MSEKKDNFICNLRAIIISSKGGLPLVNVEHDYLEAFGEKLPLKELGYKNLKEFFEKNQSDFHLSGGIVEAVVKSNSSHISSLVRRQKTNKTKTTKNSNKVDVQQIQTKNTNQPGSANGTRRPAKNAARNCKESNEKTASKSGKENQKSQGKTVSFEKITLRKPRDAKQANRNSGNTARPANTAKLPNSVEFATNARPNQDTYFPQGDTKEKLIERRSGLLAEPFGNVKDFPTGNSAQSRFLKQKLFAMQNSELQDVPNRKSNSKESQDPFQVDIGVPESHNLSGGTLPSKCPVSSAVEIGLASRQKAQARINSIKVSLQKTLMDQEVNNNSIDSNFHSNKNSGNISLGNSDNSSKSAKESSRHTESDSNSLVTEGFNSDPGPNGTMQKVITPENEFSKFPTNYETEYVKKLKELCSSRNIPHPFYKIIVREPKNEPKQYICKVQLEDYIQLSSYPIETQNPTSAKEIAAKKLYNYLILDNPYDHVSRADEMLIIPRVLDIVAPTYGIWSDKLPMLYKEAFKEALPKDWLSLLMKSTQFEIDSFDGHRFIIRKKSYVNCGSPEKVEEQSVEQKMDELKFPDSEYWEVYITNIVSSDEIWCRLIGENYSDAYDTMMTKLELEPPKRKASTPKIGGIYGVKVSSIWYRVKLVEIKNEKQALAFYIDVGDKEAVSLNELYEPEDIYFTVAPQAFVLSLHELASFSDDEELTGLITRNLLGNTYVAEVITLSKENINGELGRTTVKLWDTSTERDINVNQLLQNNIIKTITVPCLPSTSKIEEVFVSSISDNGDIYIQTNKRSVHHLKCLIFNKLKSLEGDKLTRKTNYTIGTDILYLTKWKTGDIFCRTKIIEIQSSSTVDVRFVDYGCIERISISDLIHLERTSILQAIPAQALKVKMANLTNFNLTVLQNLRDTLLDQNVLIKVISSDRGSSPHVEFFKRCPADNTLYSVNMKLNNNPELKNSNAPKRRKSIVVGLENVLPMSLPPPELPEIGQLFEVFVTFASSPDLFIVQPLVSRMALMEIMNELQVLYAGVDNSTATSNDFIIGELYAVQHPDGNWYRGCTQFAVGADNYSMYLCDFGDCIMVTKEKIKPLPSKYKTFPYQAIRATLSGIPPQQRDWTPVDCITFHKLVVEKYFISTVIEINRDERNPNYVNLGLILTDTSGEDDIYIHKVLLENKNEALTIMKNLPIN